MPRAKPALEQELSAFFDSATKITAFISSAPFVLLSDSFSEAAEKELGEAELWFVALGRMLFKTSSRLLCVFLIRVVPV